MYWIATYIVQQFWGSSADMADGLGVLLLTWNQAFYRYGSFDFKNLEDFLERRKTVLEGLRTKRLEEESPLGEADLADLFRECMDALRNAKGRSPVATAKALHLLAPDFLALWDNSIAREYGCMWYGPADAPRKYVRFLDHIRDVVVNVMATYAADKGVALSAAREHLTQLPDGRRYLGNPSSKPLLKLVDEFNYAKYKQGWV